MAATSFDHLTSKTAISVTLKPTSTTNTELMESRKQRESLHNNVSPNSLHTLWNFIDYPGHMTNYNMNCLYLHV